MGQIGPANVVENAGVLVECVDEFLKVPDYLSALCKSHCFMMKGDGPLPPPERYYIAMLAVARHRCRWLLDVLKVEFLKARGDERWLRGYQSAPLKLQMVNDLNKLLAHKPWLLDSLHIRKLLGPGKNKWLLGEVVQAICILTHFHSLCSIVYGQDLKPLVTENVDMVPSEGRKRKARSISFRLPLVDWSDERQASAKIRYTREKQDDDRINGSTAAVPDTCLEAFVEDEDFCYEDWSREGKENVQYLSPSDYGWDTQGFCMLNRMYNDVGYLLDERFRLSQSLSKSELRRGVWDYVQDVYGIQMDDYDHTEVTKLIDDHVKQWIKTAICYPEQLGTQRPPQCDRAHILMLVTEARVQCALLYALRALSRHYMFPDR